jgi:toxin ParE1/3/4
MTKWQVVYSDQAELDLRSIYEYLAFSLIAPEIAKKQAKRIMDRISKLNQMPLRYNLYEKEPFFLHVYCYSFT